MSLNGKTFNVKVPKASNLLAHRRVFIVLGYLIKRADISNLSTQFINFLGYKNCVIYDDLE